MNAYLVTDSGRGSRQEWYDGHTKWAAKRAHQLRKKGYNVVVSPRSMQVTRVGRCLMQMITIFNSDDNLPEIQVIN